MNKGLLIFVILLAAAGISWVLWTMHQRKLRDAVSPLPQDTYIAAADRGQIIQSVASPGQISSNLDVSIKCQASGEVKEMPFDISDHVKKDDVIMKLDPVDEQILMDQADVTLEQSKSHYNEAVQAERQAEIDLQTAIEKTNADLASAKVQATNLQNKADRQKQLLTQRLASQEDYETAQTDAAQALDTFKAAQIAVEEIKSQQVALETRKEDVKLADEQVHLSKIADDNATQQLSYCTVKSPIDGVVADIPVGIGIGTVIASAISNVGGGTTVMTVSDLSRIFVMATVDESDIGGVTVGQKVNITADSFPTKHFDGKVSRISPQGVTSSNVVTFEVKIEVTSDNKNMLKPQMTANVQIVEAEVDNVVMVPMLAVVHQKTKTYVTVQKADNSLEDVNVTTGINDGDNEEITSGLNGGEQVVVHKNEALNHWTSQGQPAPRPLTMPGGGGRR